ncbi:MAG: hypothetical protein Roseis2KO_42580 [Roseivirga sp.]
MSLICFSHISQAQSRSEFRKKTIEHLNKGEYDSAFYYSKLALEANKTPGAQADMAVLIGKIKRNTDSKADVIFFYDSLGKELRTRGFESYLATSLNDLARTYREIGFRDQALKNYKEAHSLFIKKDDLANAYRVANSIAILFKENGDYSGAKTYYQNALNIKETLKDDLGKATVLNNIGNLYMELKLLDSALIVLRDALQIKIEKGARFSQSITLTNLGEVFWEKQQYDSAEMYFLQARVIKEEYQHNYGLSIVYNNLAKLYLKTGNLNKAEQFLFAGDSTSRKHMLIQGLSENLRLKSRFYEIQNRPFEAMKSMKEHLFLEDSLNIKAKQTNELMAAFQRDQSEKEIDLQEAQLKLKDANLQNKNYTIVILIISSATLLIISTLLFLLYRLKQKQKKAAEWRMREQHHRVGNNIAVLSTLLNQAGNDANSDEAKALALEGKSRLEAMNLLHSKLYWKDETATIPLKPYIAQLTNQILSLYIPYHPNAVALELEEIALPVTQAIPLSLIINEIITNSCKYGLRKSESPKLEIKLFTKDGKLEIVIKNNGVSPGPVNRAQDTASFGHTLIQTLSQQLKGAFSLDIQGTFAIGKFEMPV